MERNVMVMKYVFILLLAMLVTVSCKENKAKEKVEINSPAELKEQKKNTPDIADQGFKDGLTGGVWHQYLKLRMALTEGDVEAAATASGDMAEFFDQEHPALKSLAEELASTGDLETQRVLFSRYTELAGPLFEEALGSGTIYKIHCPMAFNNEGANWYSDVPEVRNPYFGDQMLKCGKVTETIKGK